MQTLDIFIEIKNKQKNFGTGDNESSLSPTEQGAQFCKNFHY